MNTQCKRLHQAQVLRALFFIFILVLGGCNKKAEAPGIVDFSSSTADASSPVFAPAPDSSAEEPAAAAPDAPRDSAAGTPPHETPASGHVHAGDVLAEMERKIPAAGDGVFAAGDRAPASVPAPAPTPSNSRESIDRALAALASANIAFNTPAALNIEESVTIELLLSMQKAIAELKSELRAPGEREGATIKIANLMEAQLSGPDFQITALTPESQPVGSSDTVQWQWEVKPLAAGRHVLHLTLTAVLTADGKEMRKAIRTFDKQIEIDVRITQLMQSFIENNWQWAWSALLLPIGGWIWKRKSAKKKAAKKKPPIKRP